MTEPTFTCAREGCGEEYTKKTHNQKYHNDECCRLATNRRIMQNYYAKRDRKSGKERICTNCETTKLSRYNDGDLCSACKSKSKDEANNALTAMIMNTQLVA
jgi:hypothetical protein